MTNGCRRSPPNGRARRSTGPTAWSIWSTPTTFRARRIARRCARRSPPRSRAASTAPSAVSATSSPTGWSVRNSLPGPGRWATLRGLLPVPFRRFPDFLREMTARYGNVVAFSLPWRSYVFVNEPALVKDILVTQQHAFSKSLGTRVLRLLLGDGLLTSEDPLHRQMRRIVQPAFHRERIAEYVRIMERDAQEFADRLAPDKPFDAHAAMTELTLRIATETLFGSDESDSARVVGDALRLMMVEFPHMLTPLGALRQRLPLPNTRRFWRARATLDEIIYGLIARPRRDAVDPPDPEPDPVKPDRWPA